MAPPLVTEEDFGGGTLKHLWPMMNSQEMTGQYRREQEEAAAVAAAVGLASAPLVDPVLAQGMRRRRDPWNTAQIEQRFTHHDARQVPPRRHGSSGSTT